MTFPRAKNPALAKVRDETTRLLPPSFTGDYYEDEQSGESSSSIPSSAASDSSDERFPERGRIYGAVGSGYDSKSPGVVQVVVEEERGDLEANDPGNDAAAGKQGGGEQAPVYGKAFVAKIIVALLLGVFTTNADGSLVIATHPTIASEFNDLEDSSWLFISFLLAGAATQSLYGKLSDIYGRKPILLICYALFAIGCALIGVGQSMFQVIVGRLISGSSGAGLTLLFAVIITDLVPLREVATWQSYLNVVATAGRSIGGPVGGVLADTIGWRWSFLGQAPIFVVAMIAGWFALPNMSVPSSQSSGSASGQRLDQHQQRQQQQLSQEDTNYQRENLPPSASKTTPTAASKLARIDFLGTFLLGAGILCLLLPLEVGGSKIPWTHPLIYVLFVGGAALLAAFAAVEAWWAREPVFPLRLLRERDVVLSYVILGCQAAAQLDMMFTVPLYFQVTERSSNTVAGAHLFPAVVGNTVGSIIAGYWIKRTGRYKSLLILASLFSFSAYLLMALRWHGQPSLGWFESLYIVPGGFGCGMAMSVVFVAVQAAIDPSDKAVAASGLYLALPVGGVIGMAASSAVLTTTLRRTLVPRLLQLGLGEEAIGEVVEHAIARVEYLDEAPRNVARAVVGSYVDGLVWSYGVSMILTAMAFACALLIRERKLSG